MWPRLLLKESGRATVVSQSSRSQLFHYSLSRSLRRGRYGRPSLPIELVILIFGIAGFVKDVTPRWYADSLVLHKQLPVKVRSSGRTQCQLVLHTIPMASSLLTRLRQLRVETISCGSPEVWTWFEVVILRPQADRSLKQTVSQTSGIPTGYVIATEPTNPPQPLVWRSHCNRSLRLPVFTEGRVFTYDHPIWSHLAEGDLIGVQACARSSSSGNHVSGATLVFWEKYDLTVWG